MRREIDFVAATQQTHGGWWSVGRGGYELLRVAFVAVRQTRGNASRRDAIDRGFCIHIRFSSWFRRGRFGVGAELQPQEELSRPNGLNTVIVYESRMSRYSSRADGTNRSKIPPPCRNTESSPCYPNSIPLPSVAQKHSFVGYVPPTTLYDRRRWQIFRDIPPIDNVE